MIPDFKKLGYNLLALVLVKHKGNSPPKAFAEAQRKGMERLRAGESPEIVMAKRGIGLGWDTISWHTQVIILNTCSSLKALGDTNTLRWTKWIVSLST
jgi:hypothetical protein